MTRVSSSRTGAAGDGGQARRPRNLRMVQLKKLDKVLDAQRDTFRDHRVDLEHHSYDSVKLPDGRILPDFQLYSGESSKIDNYAGLAIDRERNEFYARGYSTDYGPFELPRGFKYQDLFYTGHQDPRPRNKGEKVLAAISKAVREQEPDLFGADRVHMDWDLDGRTWRTPTGGKLHKAVPYDERFEYGKQSFMFDLRKKEFWLEMIPGVSGQCWGPFKLPDGFTKKDVDALEKVDRSEPAPARTSDSYEPSRPSHSHYIGGDDSDSSYNGPRLRDVIGGDDSPTSPSSAYWNWRGGGGGGSE